MKKRYLTLMSIAVVLVTSESVNAAEATPPATETKTTATESKTTPAAEAKTTTTETTVPGTTVPGGTVAEGTAKPAKPVYCQTSGKIRVRADSKNGCDSAQKPYRSFSKDQIDTTGKIDVAEALEQLDPIFHPN